MANHHARIRTAPETVRLNEWVDRSGFYILLSPQNPTDQADDDEEYREADSAPRSEPMRK